MPFNEEMKLSQEKAALVFNFAKCSHATLLKCNAPFSAHFKISNGNGKKADTKDIFKKKFANYIIKVLFNNI